MNADAPAETASRSPGAFVIVAPLETVRTGSEFRTDSLPLHVTLVPPFTTSAPIETVTRLVESTCQGFRALTVRAARRELFGRHRDVPVVTLEQDDALRGLHTALLDAIEPVAQERADRHVRDDYRPHTSVQRGRTIVPGEPVTIDRVALVDRRPDGQSGLRRVVILVPLPRQPSRAPRSER